jgi:hypothetical protein
MTAMFAAASAFYGQLKYNIKDMMRKNGAAPEERVVAITQKLRSEGYVVIPGYYNAEQCAFAKSEIDRLICEQPDALQKDKTGSDRRIFGGERASVAARAFHDDVFCSSIGKAYRRGPLKNFSTLCARLTATEGNLGSGQGWHRDAFYFQYKSMVYLSDVGPDNGPFELLPGSHRVMNVVRDTLMGRLAPPPASRITEEQVARLLEYAPGRAVSLPAAAGTLVLFDSSTIHRGMPIKTGTRYAMTNYFFAPENITPSLERAFAPFARG